jgi:hypothetical protein
MSTTGRVLTPLLCLAACLVSLRCGSAGIAGGASETGNAGIGAVRVETFDAPPPDSIEQVLLEFVRVEAHSIDSGWVVLSEYHRTVDYLALVNGLTAGLADSTVPVGDYNQIRVYLGEGNSVVANGTTYPLTVPGGATSGIMVRVQFSVSEAETALVYLDFDASESLVQNANGFLLQPSVRAFDGTLAGRVSGTVVDSVGAPVRKAEVLATGLTGCASTLTNNAGRYTLIAPPDTYTLTCSSSKLPSSDTSYAAVEVSTGNTTAGMDFVLRGPR